MMSNSDIRVQYIGNTPSSDIPLLSLIIGSIIINVFIYKVLPLSLTPSIKSYIISTVHAIISVISVVNYFLRYEINFKQINRMIGGGVFGTGDEIMAYSIAYSCGYLIYDLILMLICKSVRTSSAVIHHILILASFLTGLFKGICHPCHFYFLAEELSTIPLNLKTIFRNRARLHHIFSLLFVICFFTSRLIYGSIVCGYAFRAAPEFLRMAWNYNDKTNFFMGILQAFLCILTRILNFYWAFLILHKVLDFKSSKKPNENKNKAF